MSREKIEKNSRCEIVPCEVQLMSMVWAHAILEWLIVNPGVPQRVEGS